MVKDNERTICGVQGAEFSTPSALVGQSFELWHEIDGETMKVGVSKFLMKVEPDSEPKSDEPGSEKLGFRVQTTLDGLPSKPLWGIYWVDAEGHLVGEDGKRKLLRVPEAPVS